MAGIPGQPGTKPSQVTQPVPQVGDPFAEGPTAQADPFAEAPSSGGVDPFAEAPAQQNSGAMVDPNSMGGKVIQGVASALPVGMGIVGAIAGGGPNPIGITVGALAAAGGAGYKRMIEQQILGKKPELSKDAIETGNKLGVSPTSLDNMSSMGQLGMEFGSDSAIGEAALNRAMAAGKWTANTKLGQAAGKWAMEQSAPVLKYIGEFTDGVKKNIVAPIQEWVDNNMAAATAEQSGDFAKDKIRQAVTTTYKGFQDSYARIKDLSGSVPMPNEARYSLSGGIRQDVRGLPKELADMAGDYAKQFDGAINGSEMQSVLSRVDEQIAQLSQRPTTGAIRDKLDVLQQISDRASDFLENHTYDLAKRVANGKASMQEMQAFEGMMRNQPFPGVPAEAGNIEKYTKSVAKDFIDNRNAVQADYARFRHILEDTGEAAGVKAGKLGPMQFLRKIDDVSSEKLISRMFTEKDASTLRALSESFPEVFDAVKQAKVRSIYNNSLENGVVNYKSLAKNLEGIPEDARRMLIPDEKLAQFNQIATGNNFKLIDKLADNWAINTLKGAIDIAHAGFLGLDKASRDVAKSQLMQKVAPVVADKTAGAALRNTIFDTYFPNSPAGGKGQ